MGGYPQINAPAMGDGGEELDYWTDGEYPITVRVSFPANENGMPESETCVHCSDEITRDDESEPWQSRTHGAECADNVAAAADGEEDLIGPHEVTPSAALHPSRWLNSACVTVDEEEVTCVVSVNDPRGGFAFTVRRNPDGGFYIHTPYPGEPMPHMRTEEVHPGTLRTVQA